MEKQKIEKTIAMIQMNIKWKREQIKTNEIFFPKQDNSRLEEDIEVYETAIWALEKQLPREVKIKDGVQ